VPVISSDRARKLAAGIAATARADASLYDREARDSTYVQIARDAAGVLESGRGAILDASFSAAPWRRLAAETARARNADFVFIEATCADRDRLRQRLAARRQGGSVSDATDQLLDTFLRDFEPVSSRDPGPRFSVDTGGTPEAALGEAVRKLSDSGIFPAAARRAS
jgi:predicted kinase